MLQKNAYLWLGLSTSLLLSATWLSTGLPLSAGKPLLTASAGTLCAGGDQRSGSGCLFVAERGQAFALKRTDVKARIAGNIARVEVVQTFENPFEEALEAIYVFPLPDEAAVDEMEIRIGNRVIKGNIKRREEAQRLYRQARAAGRTAGLLEQERDNIFTQTLANIRPGERVEVVIRYTESLKFEKGDYEFVFPMVVGPRYIPGTPIAGGRDTERVPDAGRITPPVARPEVRSGHDIGVSVEIDAGVPVQTVRSTSHTIQVQKTGQRLQVRLGEGDTLPNKDLILRYRVAGNRTQATVISQADSRGGHFVVYLIPAVQYQAREIVPKDVVFLMDTSGSQSGDPLVKSQALMRQMIAGLNPDDTFAIINFANTTEQLSTLPLANTAANRASAIRYIDALSANGGSELLNGIQKVLAFPEVEPGRLRSIVLLTDGFIGDDKRVIAEVQRRLQPGNRVYTFGVGSSVNRFLINRLAEVGRGTAQVIRQDEPAIPVAEKFFRQINNPVLTNLQVQWQGEGEAAQVYPLAAPDLFTNQPLVLYGRKPDRQNGSLLIRGTTANGEAYEKTIAVRFGDGNRAVAQLWGRARIKDLTNRMLSGDTKTGVEAVTTTALAYNLLSEYTAFVAISEEVRVEPNGQRRTVQVPVEIPQGVNYDTTVVGAGPSNGAAPYRAKASRPMPATTRAPRQEEDFLDGVSVTSTRRADRTREQSAATPPIAPPPPMSASTTQLIQTTNLDATLKADLVRHLESLALLSPGNDKVVFEVSLQNGRVVRVLLVEEDTTLKTGLLLDQLRQHLQSWVAPAGITLTTRLTLRV